MIYISKIKLHNFKSFHDFELKFDRGINFLVGNNNCGKTTIFSAIQGIIEKSDPRSVISKDKMDDENEFVAIEVILSGDNLDEFLDSDSNLRKYKPHVYEEDSLKCLHLKRSSKPEENESGKTIGYDKIKIINHADNKIYTPTGADSTIAALFDIQLVLADTKSSDYFDLSKTKLCGKLIKSLTNLDSIEEWVEFEKQHEIVFDKINTQLSKAKESITKHLREQYSEDSEAEFNFKIPEISEFLRNGTISLKESEIETDSSEKGTGMQRALVLAVMQSYSELVTNTDDLKPTFFLLDEPETFLHPQAQQKLLDALDKISLNSQIFITTHSPYLLTKYKPETNALIVFGKQNNKNVASSSAELNLFGNSSPTWGEINYEAFGLYTTAFHDELYGFLISEAKNIDEKYEKEKEFNEFLNNHGIQDTMIWKREMGGTVKEEPKTLPIYIRNFIHHPENTNNSKYTEKQLEESIELLLNIYKTIKKKNV